VAKNKVLTEGTVFGIPLQDGGFAIGLIARASRRGVLLGYFWAEWKELPEVGSLTLSRDDTILVARFGDLFLQTGRWVELGTLPSWDRKEWPMPIFVREEMLTGRRWEVRYSDDDPNALIGEYPAAANNDYPPDSMYGAEATEITLKKRLSER